MSKVVLMKAIVTPSFFKAEGVEWESVYEGISRQFIGFNTQLMRVKVKFRKGAIGYIHDHFHSQVTYVASGKFKVTINGMIKYSKQETVFLYNLTFDMEPNVFLREF